MLWEVCSPMLGVTYMLFYLPCAKQTTSGERSFSRVYFTWTFSSVSALFFHATIFSLRTFFCVSQYLHELFVGKNIMSLGPTNSWKTTS